MTAREDHRKPWSLSDIEELNLMLRGQIDRKEIAAQLGRTEEAVAAKIYKLSGQRARQAGTRKHPRRNAASFFLS